MTECSCWKYVGGLITPSFTLFVAGDSISSLAVLLSQLSPICWRYSVVGFIMFTWEASAFSRTFTCISSSEHTDNYGWHAGCCSELTFFFFQTCKLLPKALTVTCQGDAPCLFLFCGNIVVSTRMLQSEGLTIKNLHSDLHGLSGLSKLVPCLCCASCEAHCRVQLLKPAFLG